MTNHTDPLTPLQDQFQEIKQRIANNNLPPTQAIIQFRNLLGKLTTDTPAERRLAALISNTIGVSYSTLGNMEGSNDYYRIARDHYLKLDQPIAALHVELNITLNLMRTGTFKKLIEAFDLILETGQALSGANLAVVLAYSRLYRCACQLKVGEADLQGVYTEVTNLHHDLQIDSQDIDQENLERLQTESLLTLAEIDLRLGKYDSAYQHIQDANTSAQSELILVGQINQAMGDLITYSPRPEWGQDPDKAYRKAQDCFGKANAQDMLGNAFIAQGYSASYRGQYSRAAYWMNQAIARYAGHSKTFRLQQALDTVRRLNRNLPFEPKPFFIGE